MKTQIFYTDGTFETFEGIKNPYKVCAVSSIKLVVEYDNNGQISNIYNPNDQ